MRDWNLEKIDHVFAFLRLEHMPVNPVRHRNNSSQAVDAAELASLRTLWSVDQFNAGEDEDITRYYSRAKRAVAQRLEKIGRSNLERIRNEASLKIIFGP